MDSCTCCDVIDEFALTTKVDLRSSHFLPSPMSANSVAFGGTADSAIVQSSKVTLFRSRALKFPQRNLFRLLSVRVEVYRG